MLWLAITILAYFLLSLSALGDKYILSGPPNPKIYSFYNGVLGIFAVILIPFVTFAIPDSSIILISLLAGAVFIMANYCYFFALEHFDVSRVAPSIGALLPIFTFSFVFIFAGEKNFLTSQQFIAFALLIFGGIAISSTSLKKFSFKSVGISALAALLFAVTFLLSKYVYSNSSFWSGFILMRIGSFFAVLFFIFSKSVRDEIFRRTESTFKKKTGIIYAFTQAVGGGAFVLQSWAVALAPIGFLPFINALEGIKYVFLLTFVLILGKFLPKGLQEETSKKITIQKTISIVIICAGLAFLSFK